MFHQHSLVRCDMFLLLLGYLSNREVEQQVEENETWKTKKIDLNVVSHLAKEVC
jgi:hypothetical protein